MQVQMKQICEACGEQVGGSPESDVILPYLELCLIT